MLQGPGLSPKLTEGREEARAVPDPLCPGLYSPHHRLSTDHAESGCSTGEILPPGGQRGYHWHIVGQRTGTLPEGLPDVGPSRLICERGKSMLPLYVIVNKGSATREVTR